MSRCFLVPGIRLPDLRPSASELRDLSLTIGTQTLSQISGSTIEAVFGNSATIVSSRVSGDDAKALVREFAASGEGPRTAEQAYDIIIPASALHNLPDYKLYVRTLLAGRPLEPFLVQSFPPFSKSGKENTASRVITTSSRRYGRDHKAVEKMLNWFLSS